MEKFDGPYTRSLGSMAPNVFPEWVNVSTSSSEFPKTTSEGGPNVFGIIEYLQDEAINILNATDYRVPTVLKNLYKHYILSQDREKLHAMNGWLYHYQKSLKRLQFMNDCSAMFARYLCSHNARFMPISKAVNEYVIEPFDIINDIKYCLNGQTLENWNSGDRFENPYCRYLKSISLEIMKTYMRLDNLRPTQIVRNSTREAENDITFPYHLLSSYDPNTTRAKEESKYTTTRPTSPIQQFKSKNPSPGTSESLSFESMKHPDSPASIKPTESEKLPDSAVDLQESSDSQSLETFTSSSISSVESLNDVYDTYNEEDCSDVNEEPKIKLARYESNGFKKLFENKKNAYEEKYNNKNNNNNNNNNDDDYDDNDDDDDNDDYDDVVTVSSSEFIRNNNNINNKSQSPFIKLSERLNRLNQ